MPAPIYACSGVPRQKFAGTSAHCPCRPPSPPPTPLLQYLRSFRAGLVDCGQYHAIFTQCRALNSPINLDTGRSLSRNGMIALHSLLTYLLIYYIGNAG